MQNQATLSANSTYGILRGIETFLQLVKNGPNCSHVPAVDIVDEPRFPWRGLMLDSARHFIPVKDIKRLVDKSIQGLTRTGAMSVDDTERQGVGLASREF